MASKADIIRRLRAELEAITDKIAALDKVPDIDNMVVGTMVRVTVSERRRPERGSVHLLHKIATEDGPAWSFTGELAGMQRGYNGLSKVSNTITWDGLIHWAAEHVEIEAWEMLMVAPPPSNHI